MDNEMVDVSSYPRELYGKPVRIFANSVEKGALKQFESVMGLNCIVKGACLPDMHHGYSLNIGGVVASEGVIFPAFVGFDIGCGVCALPTTFRKSHVEQRAKKIFDEIYRLIPVGLGKQNLTPTPWDYSGLDMTAKMKEIFSKDGLQQLGSLGSGNHFIEVDYDEEDTIWIVVHSGSRNIGRLTAQWYMGRASGDGKAREGLLGLKVDSDDGRGYIIDMNFCLEFALANRMEIVQRAAKVLHKYCIGRPNFAGLINRHHNHAEQRDGLWIHRKGATHAEAGMMGVIPGNMRDGSFIVEGKGNPDSLYSSSHGAGRTMSRSSAKNAISMSEFKKTMGGITAKIDHATLDEFPGAYKDIEEVIKLQADLITVKHRLKPLINIKG